MASDKLRVGMVGAGSFARNHLEAWNNSGADVVCIWNRSPEKAQRLADEFDVPTVCADLDELITGDDVDVVSVSMPHNMHHPICLAAIQAGKHVFCEKPLGLSLAEAQELWQASREAGVKTGMQFFHRSHPALCKMQALIADGYLGQPQYAELKFGMDVARDPQAPLIWRFNKSIAGSGVLGDLGVYMIDMARWMWGEFDRVVGDTATWITERPTVSDRYDLHQVMQMMREDTVPDTGETAPVETDDEAQFMAVFGNGAQGFFRVSYFHDGRLQRFHGSEGVLSWDPAEERLFGKSGYGGTLEEIDVPEVETPATIVTQFVDNIRDNTDLAPTFFDGVRAQEVMAAVSLSAQESRWVSLPLESA